MAFESGRQWEFKDCAHYWPEVDESKLFTAGPGKTERIVTVNNKPYPLYLNIGGRQFKVPTTVKRMEG